MRITSWGAAGTVTGSRFVVEAGGRRMLVDCRLGQASSHAQAVRSPAGVGTGS